MPASIFLRGTRAFASQLEIGIDTIERMGQGSLSRHSVREVEDAQEQAREGRFQAERRKAAAGARRDRLTSEAATWGEKAAYALTKNRTDLAQRAVERQIDCEAQAAAAGEEMTKAGQEIARLATLTEALGEERRRMIADLKAMEQVRTAVEQDAPITIEQRAERARARFERMMDELKPEDEASAAAGDLAELDALRRADAVEERLTALRTAAGSKRKRG